MTINERNEKVINRLVDYFDLEYCNIRPIGYCGILPEDELDSGMLTLYVYNEDGDIDKYSHEDLLEECPLVNFIINCHNIELGYVFCGIHKDIKPYETTLEINRKNESDPIRVVVYAQSNGHEFVYCDVNNIYNSGEPYSLDYVYDRVKIDFTSDNLNIIESI